MDWFRQNGCGRDVRAPRAGSALRGFSVRLALPPASGLLSFLEVVLLLASRVLEELVSYGHGLVDGLDRFPLLLVLAKKLFAHEEQSYTEPVAFDVLVMPLAWADLLAILHGIAAEGHSGAVSIAVHSLVLAQALLDDSDHVRFGEELVRSLGHVPLRELYGPVERLFAGQLALLHLQLTSVGAARPILSCLWASHGILENASA